MKIIWNYDNRKRKKVDKRSLICLGAFVMAFVVLIVTLFDMQILNGSSYANSAVTRKTRTLTVPGTEAKSWIPTAYLWLWMRKYIRLSFTGIIIPPPSGKCIPIP